MMKQSYGSSTNPEYIMQGLINLIRQSFNGQHNSN